MTVNKRFKLNFSEILEDLNSWTEVKPKNPYEFTLIVSKNFVMLLFLFEAVCPKTKAEIPFKCVTKEN